MKRPRKSNGVSWASEVYLCQVKLFLSEDCPSKVGQKFQDHLQAKASFMLHSSPNEPNDLPPGFEGNHFVNQSKDELSRIPQIKWKCPPQFVFNYAWRVAAGEESREKEDQKIREMRVLEAVYPRLSAIPPCPSVSLDVEEEDYDDSLIPLVPLIPIEEESVDINAQVASAATITHMHQYASATTAPISSQCNTHATLASPACGRDAGLAAIMKSNEQGGMIDMDLLVRIFNDPILIEKLISEYRIAGTTALNPAIPFAPRSSPAPDKPASGISPISMAGLSSASVPKPATTSVSSLMPKSDKPATPSVPISKSMPEKPVTVVPFSRPMPDKPASAFPFSKPMPEKASTPPFPLPPATPDMHRPVNKSIHHLSNGVLPALNTLLPQQDTVLASRIKQAASLTSISSNETNMVSLPSAGGNLNSVANQVPPTVSTMHYQPSTSSTFAMKEAYPVKDANYYKNLVRQHGTDKQDMLDSQIGSSHNNFQDLKPVHNHKPGEVKFKTQKPCLYFNSSRGCRNGSNCPYQHDMSVPWGAGSVLGSQNHKRMKLGPEIKGKT
ncbi:hypothetical protein L6164_020139 [Bauhinia variegata]|uniref:Uncharacterized protein n=1 Tax=Bauhinia variegata TaxID=167791 RepID=A0ACB9MUK2_BAUVA|nr:hypothetical protein L6164_020139 [Bauhinia variegata]